MEIGVERGKEGGRVSSDVRVGIRAAPNRYIPLANHYGENEINIILSVYVYFSFFTRSFKIIRPLILKLLGPN